MINLSGAKALRASGLALTTAAMLVLAGCGGGSDGSTLTGGGGSGTTTGTPTPTPAAASVTFVTPTSSPNITLGQGAAVKVSVLDSNAQPVQGAVVTFSADGTLAVASPTTALTGADGTASSTLNAISATAAGAGTLTVNAVFTVKGTSQTAQNTLTYAVGGSGLSISKVTLGTNTLAAYQSTSVDVSVTSGTAAIGSQAVAFTSACVAAGKATISGPVVTDNSGVAHATYTDQGCRLGSDTIITSVTGATSVSTALTINAAPASSLRFTGIYSGGAALTTGITLRGASTPSRPDTAQVTFTLVDANSNPIPAQNVTLSLNQSTGGITLVNASSDGTITMPTQSDGTVTVTVQAGTIPTPVRVQAKLASNPAISSISSALAISSGYPDDAGMSFSATKYAMRGLDFDGDTTTITVRMSDHFRNPVPDGTTVNFIADGGLVAGSGTQGQCQTVNSACTVTLTTQNPRPSNGRIHVLAYALGEETFADLNSNNYVDEGDSFVPVGDPFLDIAETGVYAAPEQIIDAAGDGYTLPDASVYHGSLCLNSWSKCSSTKTIYIFRNATFTFSGPAANITTTSNLALACNNTNTSAFLITDSNGNPTPAGTQIDISAVGNNGATVPASSNYVVVNGAPGAQQTHVVGLDAFLPGLTTTGTCTPGSGVITVTVTHLDGTVVRKAFNYTVN